MSLVVVTGASRGIGRSVAILFSKRGHDVALIGRDERALEETRAMVAGEGREARAVVCDVSKSGDVHEALATVQAWRGVPAVVVNAAGVVVRAPVHEMSEADWDRVLGTNLKGTFLVSRAFLVGMLAQKTGRIVSVSSISGTLGTPRLSAYCASKWGVLGFTKALAEELRGTGLQAMAVLPGSVDTDMLKGSGFAPAMLPEEVARLIVYAALDAPASMNGAAVEIFGP